MPWLMQRMDEGFALSANPFNPKQVKRVELTPEAIDALVFWTKQPGGLLPHLQRLAPYRYMAQVTLNDYSADIEPAIPPLGRRLADFSALSEAIGPRRVRWRYDPILLNAQNPPEAHIERFEKIAQALRGKTEGVTISFLDDYPRIHRKLAALGVRFPDADEKRAIALALAGIAHDNGMRITACCEAVDLSENGVAPAACIDAALIAGLWGGAPAKKDVSQRPGCGCAAAVDIGTYGTCTGGCVYCYARGRSSAR